MTVFTPDLEYSALRDVNSFRAKIATIVQTTNTTVEHDFHAVAPRGVTFPVGRMYIPRPESGNDSEFAHIIQQVDSGLADAIRSVMTTGPDHVVMAMSAPTFWGSLEGNARIEARMRELSGLDGVTSGSTAVREALNTLGAKNIAFISPYQQVGDDHVEQFFTDAGFNVKRSLGLRVPSIDYISRTPASTLIAALREVDGDDVDVLVQAGTNLSMVRLADEAERWLGKPVVTINAATLWHALRHCAVNDQFDGFGTLLRDF